MKTLITMAALALSFAAIAQADFVPGRVRAIAGATLNVSAAQGSLTRLGGAPKLDELSMDGYREYKGFDLTFKGEKVRFVVEKHYGSSAGGITYEATQVFAPNVRPATIMKLKLVDMRNSLVAIPIKNPWVATIVETTVSGGNTVLGRAELDGSPEHYMVTM